MVVILLIFYTASMLALSLRVSSSENNWGVRTSTSTGTPVISSQQRQLSLPAIKVDTSGKVSTIQILKQQLSNELSLPLRDLRLVDPSLPKQIQATFTSRPKAILFCIENIKVIVQHNEALIFSPFQPEVKDMIPVLQQLLSQSSRAARFEHLVIEAALNVVCTNLFRQVRELSPAVASTLNGLRVESRGLDVVQTQVDELLPQKNKLDELRKRVKEVRRAINDILHNDEDMSMMYLSPPRSLESKYAGSSRTTLDFSFVGPTTSENLKTDGFQEDDEKEHDSSEAIETAKSADTDRIISIPVKWKGSENNERQASINTMGLEMLFENYLNEVEWIASEIEEIIDEVTNTEEYVALQLDLLRNRILRFELIMNVAAFVLTWGALITGFFGMNLKNHFESSGLMFLFIFVTTFAGMGAMFVKIRRYGRNEKLF